MDDIKKSIIKHYGNKLRIRVCGICIENNKILLVNHHSLNEESEFWSPPGGGMEYGTSAEENLKREFFEETGLKIEIEKFLFVHEYLKQPLHAIELIFLVKRIKGDLSIGFDPEMESDKQIIKDVKFISFDKINLMQKENVHQLFKNIESFEELSNTSGYFIWKK